LNAALSIFLLEEKCSFSSNDRTAVSILKLFSIKHFFKKNMLNARPRDGHCPWTGPPSREWAGGAGHHPHHTTVQHKADLHILIYAGVLSFESILKYIDSMPFTLRRRPSMFADFLRNPFNHECPTREMSILN